MGRVELFSEPAQRTRYRAGLCSAAALGLALLGALTYVPPLLVAYRSHGPRPGGARVRVRGPGWGWVVGLGGAGWGARGCRLTARPRRTVAHAGRVPRAAGRPLPLRGAAAGHDGGARRRPGLEHVPRLQPPTGRAPARPARRGACGGAGRGRGVPGSPVRCRRSPARPLGSGWAQAVTCRGWEVAASAALGTARGPGSAPAPSCRPGPCMLFPLGNPS